jgi:hypothetical protein
LARITEIKTGLAGCSVKCHQAAIERAEKYSLLAGRAGRLRDGGVPESDAARGYDVPGRNFLKLRIEGPSLLAGARIDGKDYIEGRGEVEGIAGEDGCCLERCVVESGAALIQSVGVEGPCGV